MRIEAYNQVAQLYKLNKTGRTVASDKTGTARDELQISATARDYQVAKQAVAATPDVREDKVAQLKQSIESGQYQVSDDDFAAKLIEKYNALG